MILGDYLVGNAFDGNHGVIRFGTRLSTGARVVLKELAVDANGVCAEADIMADLFHPHIVSLYDTYRIDNRVFLVMQHAPNGDLLDAISNSADGFLAVADAKRIFAQMIMALDYMHRTGYIHGDIKPDNVFLAADNSALLGDFGLSRSFDARSSSIPAFAGTLHYAAPEAFLHSPVVGPELDIWSAGAVLYVMLRGRYPFWKEDDNACIKEILFANVYWPEWFPADAIDLLSKMLAKNPHRRISMRKIMRHPFVRAEIDALRAAQVPAFNPTGVFVSKLPANNNNNNNTAAAAAAATTNAACDCVAASPVASLLPPLSSSPITTTPAAIAIKHNDTHAFACCPSRAAEPLPTEQMCAHY